MTTAVLHIDALTQGGDGIARPEGEPVVFVPGTVPGDVVMAEILPGGRDFRRARVVEILEPGAGRRAAPCPEAAWCGGCQWQHVSDDAQDAAIRSLLVDALRRVGRLDVAEGVVAPARGIGARLGYRQRARFHLDLASMPARLGFLRSGTHDVHGMPACPVLEPELDALRARIVGALPDLARSLPGARAELSLDLPASGPAAALLDVTRGRPRRAQLDSALETIGLAAPSVVAMEARCGSLSVVRGQPRIAYRRGTMDEPEAFPAFLAPGAFMQASREGNLLLTTRVLDAARALGLPRGARVLELFAGNGNFTLPLAAAGFDVHASDADARAIACARLAAHESGSSATFEIADAAAVMRARVDAGWRCDLVVLDPPRTGAREACALVSALAPGAVLYVSCDAATLARDLASLAVADYRLVRAEPLALFPQSSHFETVALVTR